MINACDFLIDFISIGKKATEIAKLIRFESGIFDILIEEKSNTFYLNRDYKTFSDVLIQETVRNDLETLQPELSKNLFGEESNEFTNKLNVNINIKIGKTMAETKSLILEVLDGHEELATKLVSLIHMNLKTFTDENVRMRLKDIQNVDFEISNLGIWIDPIDATAEYINGVGISDPQSLKFNDPSVKNVTVLMGVFSMKTGIPFIGIVYQPFSKYECDNKWCHSCYWGIKTDNITIHSDNITKRSFTFPGFAVTSVPELDYFTSKLNINCSKENWNVSNNSGAGFKFVLVFEGKSDCYILSKGSTYKWDTCGPHAILLAMGGGVIDYQQLIRYVCSQMSDLNRVIDTDDLIRSSLSKYQLTYGKDRSDDCNCNGFLAYCNVAVAISVINMFLQDL